ncbi:MAG: hypothetical protein JNK11_18340 [Alphaproteobacteria bacterium]|nr:hypothetical protein [Alphaproteobacteria bacterium]
MGKDFFAILIVGTAVINGILNPMLAVVVAFAPVWYPYVMPFQADIAFYIASLIVSGLTILISGVPAALYERMRGLKETDDISMMIWLGCAILLSLPALNRFT